MKNNYLSPLLYWFGLVYLVLLLSTESWAAPAIVWSPASIDESVGTGQTISMQVAFIASKDIAKAQLRVVPALASLVSVSPSSLFGISKGESVNLTLTISAEDDAPLGSFDGTMQLRKVKNNSAPGGTIANPLPIVISVIKLTPEQKLQVLEDQGAIPKLDRSLDYGGPDDDMNGIRDDIDSYIALNYPIPLKRDAVEQLARSMQWTILIDKTDSSAVKAESLKQSKAVNCIFQRFDGSAGTKQPSEVIAEIESISTNTKPRLLEYLAFAKALDGTVGTLPEGDTCE